jgi:hypothetical protein
MCGSLNRQHCQLHLIPVSRGGLRKFQERCSVVQGTLRCRVRGGGVLLCPVAERKKKLSVLEIFHSRYPQLFFLRLFSAKMLRIFSLMQRDYSLNIQVYSPRLCPSFLWNVCSAWGKTWAHFQFCECCDQFSTIKFTLKYLFSSPSLNLTF